MKKGRSKILLKDILFNREKVEDLAKRIQKVYPSFKKNDFAHRCLSKFSKLELKERIAWIAECLKNYLPENYKEAVKILINSLPASNNPELSDNDFGDFIYAPYGEYIAKNGCKKEYLQFSLNSLKEITSRFSAEDAIRYFINSFPKKTMRELLKWVRDSHYQVRRLCSEGTRPKLPWSQKINIAIVETIPILDQLFFDKTRFVTRSVANHLNDISKINPKLTIEILKKWKNSGRQNPKEIDYIINHSLRTLIKQGNSEALKMIGFDKTKKLVVTKFVVSKEVKMGDELQFSFEVDSKTNTKALIDYIIHFQNKTGKLASKKVFKLKKISITKNKPLFVSKKHILRENMTTRKLFRGEHKIEIQINGKIYASDYFLLIGTAQNSS